MKVSSHTEGAVAKTIEQQTTKLPSDLFLWGGLGLLAGSLFLHCMHREHASPVVGQLAAPVLIMGLYNKVVKQHGHDFVDQKPS